MSKKFISDIVTFEPFITDIKVSTEETVRPKKEE